MRTTTGKVALVVAGAALIVGISACGDASDDAAGPTVAEVQNQALAAQQKAQQPQDPALRYPPLPIPPPVPLYEDLPDRELGPRVPANALQVGQDPTATALQRIQEIAAKTADISNRHEEARQYFAQAGPFFDVAKKEIDGGTRDKLNKGFDAMRAALDRVARGEAVDGIADAEKASGDIQLAVYYYLEDNFTPHEDEQQREVFCSPTGTYVLDC